MAACIHPIILAAPQITSYGPMVITIVVNPPIPLRINSEKTGSFGPKTFQISIWWAPLCNILVLSSFDLVFRSYKPSFP